MLCHGIVAVRKQLCNELYYSSRMARDYGWGSLKPVENLDLKHKRITTPRQRKKMFGLYRITISRFLYPAVEPFFFKEHGGGEMAGQNGLKFGDFWW